MYVNDYIPINPTQNTKSAQINRNNAIINLLLSCGLRVSEVANLNLSDFKFETRQFLIHGKGKKERIGYLNDNSLHAIEEYLKIRSKVHIKDKKDNDALFLTEKGIRIDVRSIRRDIKEAYSNAGIDEKAYSVHTLRHTCATLLYKNYYGHSSVNVTKIYTHLYDKDVEYAMQQNHPLAKLKINDARELCAA